MTILRFTCLGGLLLILTGGFLAAEQASDPSLSEHEMPEVIHFHHGGYDRPIFVAASRMVDDDGFPNEEFPMYAQRTRALYKSTGPNASRCLSPMNSAEFETRSGSPRDLQAAIRTSDHVILARVTGSIAGCLHHATAGNLYRFTPIEVIRGRHVEAEKYFFFPSGEFELGQVSICKIHPDYAEAPALGDRVLLIYKDGWYNASGIVYTRGSVGVTTLKSDGTFSLPRRFRDHSDTSNLLSNENLIEAVRGFLREE